jgi:hypothetical protein
MIWSIVCLKCEIFNLATLAKVGCEKAICCYTDRLEIFVEICPTVVIFLKQKGRENF